MLWLALCTAMAAADARLLVVVDADLGVREAEIKKAFAPLAAEATLVYAGAVGDDGAAKRAKRVAAAHAACKRGRELALQLRTDRAIDKLAEAEALFGRAIAALDSLAPLAACLVDLGAAYIDKGRDDKATVAFKSALLVDAGQRPDPKAYNPEVVKRFAAAAQAIQRGPKGSLTLSIAPSDAEVLFDGRLVEARPVVLRDLPVGEHWLVVRRDGHEGYVGRVAIKSELARMEVSLRAHSPLALLLQRTVESAAGDELGGAEEQAAFAQLGREYRADTVVAVARSDDALRARWFRSADRRVSKPVEAGELGELVESVTSAMARAVIPEPAPARPDDDRLHPVIAVLPLGLGQLAQGRIAPAAAFAASQAALLALNLGSYVLLASDRYGEGLYDDPSRDRRLKLVVNLSFALLAADLAYGVYDGLSHR